jgi:hypothetical protein
MPVKVIRSSDPGAPAMTGQAGSALAVLDYALTHPVAGLGWSIAFTGTNKRVYRASVGLRHYLRVVDDGVSDGLTSARESRIRGFESMTSVDSGTNPFPTTAQSANGLPVRKSATADAVNRPWVLVGDERTFYLMVLTGDTAGLYAVWPFGEIFSVKPNDIGRSFIIGRDTENSGLEVETFASWLPLGSTGTGSGHSYLARSYTGASGAIRFGRGAHAPALGGTISFSPQVALPNPSDSRILTARIRVFQVVETAIRGWLRGAFVFLHPRASVSDGDTFQQDGRTMLLVRDVGRGTALGALAFDTTGPWDTN